MATLFDPCREVNRLSIVLVFVLRKAAFQVVSAVLGQFFDLSDRDKLASLVLNDLALAKSSTNSTALAKRVSVASVVHEI